MNYSLSDLIKGKFLKKDQSGGGGKRKHIRKRAFNLIKFTLRDGTCLESVSNILNLSEKGLQFSCYEEFQPGSVLKMTIHFPQKKHDIKLTAVLKWIRKAKSVKGVYIAGVNFEEISERDQALVKQLMEEDRE